MSSIKQLLIFVVLIITIQYSCTGQKSWIDLDTDETIAMFDSTDVVFLDVREVDELSEDGKIEEAIHIDYYQDDFKEKLNALDKTKKYVVYCRSGRRSTMACEIMKELGFQNIYNVKKGYDPSIKRKS